MFHERGIRAQTASAPCECVPGGRLYRSTLIQWPNRTPLMISCSYVPHLN